MSTRTGTAVEASMIAVGDEILDGFVQDQNSHWMAERLRQHGVLLQRVTFVRDSVRQISEELRQQLEGPRPRLLFTSGGIGSTHDDVTYQAVANSLGRELILHPALQERMEEAVAWVADQGYEA